MRDYDHHLSDHDLVLSIDRELPAHRQAATDAHLIECPLCSTRRTRLDQVGERVTALYQCDPANTDRQQTSRQELRSKLTALARAGEESVGPGVPQALVRMQRWAMAGAAAAAVILLVRIVQPFESRAVRPSTIAVERDALPVASLTPGATWNISVDEVCAPGGREQRQVAAAVRHQVLLGYGMERVPTDEYELDYLITPELGGAPDAQNLWPQRYALRTWNAHVKDQLERLLPRLVCDGTLPLEIAQREIADDWVAAYQKHFRTDVPLQMHAQLRADGVLDSSHDDTITYPVWRSGNAPALRLVSFPATR